MLNLWQECAMCSKASRSATVRTKIQHQYRSGSPLDSLEILFNDYTSYPGLRTADPSNITLLEVLRNLQPRNCFNGRYETIFRIQV